MHLQICRQWFTFCTVCPLWRTAVKSLKCDNNHDEDTWWCLESPGTAETPPARHTPVSGSLGNVFMPRVTCPRSRQTRIHNIRLSVSGGCLQRCSVYLVMTAARLLQSVSTAVSRALQETAWAGPRSSERHWINWDREMRIRVAARQSSLSDGCRENAATDDETFWHTLTFNAAQFHLLMMRVLSSLLRDDWYLLTAPWSPGQGGCDRRDILAGIISCLSGSWWRYAQDLLVMTLGISHPNNSESEKRRR